MHIQMIEPKDFRTFVRVYSLLTSQRLSINMILALPVVLIRCMTHVCPAWELAADTCLLRL